MVSNGSVRLDEAAPCETVLQMSKIPPQRTQLHAARLPGQSIAKRHHYIRRQVADRVLPFIIHERRTDSVPPDQVHLAICADSGVVRAVNPVSRDGQRITEHPISE